MLAEPAVAQPTVEWCPHQAAKPAARLSRPRRRGISRIRNMHRKRRKAPAANSVPVASALNTPRRQRPQQNMTSCAAGHAARQAPDAEQHWQPEPTHRFVNSSAAGLSAGADSAKPSTCRRRSNSRPSPSPNLTQKSTQTRPSSALLF